MKVKHYSIAYFDCITRLYHGASVVGGAHECFILTYLRTMSKYDPRSCWKFSDIALQMWQSEWNTQQNKVQFLTIHVVWSINWFDAFTHVKEFVYTNRESITDSSTQAFTHWVQTMPGKRKFNFHLRLVHVAYIPEMSSGSEAQYNPLQYISI